MSTETAGEVTPGVEVAVVGGGLAGIAAAIRLADRGYRVHLLESRARLGGVAGSFTREGLEIDTGQHVFLRCYRRYRSLLSRLGVADQVLQQDRLDLPVLLRSGGRHHLRRSRGLAAPMHLVAGLAGYGALTPGERWSAGRAAARLRKLDPADPGLDLMSFGDWLREHDQSDRAVQRLWGLISVAALNVLPDDASLALAVRVFRTGLLEDRRGCDVAIPAVPLARLHSTAAQRELDRLGARVSVRTRVQQITRPADGAGFVLHTSGGPLRAAQVILSVPHTQASRLVPADACPDAARWSGLGASAIVNCHLIFDRRVIDLRFAALPDSAVQWVFDKSEVAGLRDGQYRGGDHRKGQYLVTSVSAAGEVLSQRSGQICAEQLATLSEFLPAVRDARLVDSFVTREPRATFRQGPRSASLRPGPTTRWPGLLLAGAWTDTGWPDTMEGAVVSGERAADLVARAPTGSLLNDEVVVW